jgi:predicted DNA-binding transcriptional regulator YafY
MVNSSRNRCHFLAASADTIVAMSRSERLFDLLHALRRHRRPVSGQVLAHQVGVSIRTLYRDIATLQAQGAEITGEPGVGYVLKPGFLLPPLMFSPEEIEALVLGTRWVAGRTDARLADAARSAMARIAAVLPAELRAELEQSALIVGLHPAAPVDTVAPELLRQAVRAERRLRIAYRDASGALSQRVVWPFAIAFFEPTRVLLAWCELRAGFRHFRTERIVEAELLGERYPRRGPALLKAWSQQALQTHGRTILPEIDSM